MTTGKPTPTVEAQTGAAATVPPGKAGPGGVIVAKGNSQMSEPNDTASTAWIRLVHAARDWANHLDQWDRFKFNTEHGLVYVFVGRSVYYPVNFDLVDSLTGTKSKMADSNTTMSTVIEILRKDRQRAEEERDAALGKIALLKEKIAMVFDS
jgi:hypothetical protein